MKKLFRNKTSILLAIGIAVSFFAILNAGALMKRVKETKNEAELYRYEQMYEMVFEDVTNVRQTIVELQALDGNVYLPDNLLYMDHSNTYALSDIYIKQDKPFLFPLQSGEYTSDLKSKMLVGTGAYKYDCYKKADGRDYIMANGYEYELAGVLSGKNSDAFFAKRIIFYDFDDAKRTAIDDHTELIVRYETDDSDASEQIARMENSLTCAQMVSCEPIISSDVNAVDAGDSARFNLVIWLFASLNCIIISEFWILRRKQEMVIRKLHGYSNIGLFRLIYVEMLKISAVSVTVVWIIELGIMLITGNDQLFSPSKIFFSLSFLVLETAAIILIPIYKIAFEMPLKEME